MRKNEAETDARISPCQFSHREWPRSFSACAVGKSHGNKKRPARPSGTRPRSPAPAPQTNAERQRHTTGRHQRSQLKRAYYTGLKASAVNKSSLPTMQWARE